MTTDKPPFSPNRGPHPRHHEGVAVCDVTALVDRARQQDGAAQADLFRTHLEGVHRIVYRLAGPGPDVEDLVQTVFVEAFRSLPAFRGEALFSTWLARIAARVAMHAVRRRPPRAALLDEAGLAAPAAGPERTVAAREALVILDGLLAELRPKRRAAFVLHVLEGYSVEEVAAVLNASPSAVKVRVHDVRRHIERRCKRHPGLADLLAAGGER